MKAMILAAGRGRRMNELTNDLPKVLLPVAGKPLIQHHVERLAAAGFQDIIINLAYRGQQIQDAVGDGSQWGVRCHYSKEPEGGYETAGGIAHALPLLGDAAFLVVNGDVWTDYPFQNLRNRPAPSMLMHCVMIDNPRHRPTGDFGIHDNKLQLQAEQMVTFSGIGCYQPQLFADLPEPFYPLRPLMELGCRQGFASAEHYNGDWCDVGTPERYQEICQRVSGC